MIYLDHAAATPVAPNVLKVMQPYLTEKYFNASAGYLSAKSVAKDITDAREKVARVLGVRPSEIVFTAGGTEANNLAIRGVMDAHPGGNVVVSALEHDSVLKPAELYDFQILPAHKTGLVNTDFLAGLINDKTVLVSVMYVNNEIGTIQPLADVARIIKRVKTERLAQGNKTPLYLHTDACQAGNYLHLLADKLGVDLMTINAGKLYGPKQSGVLFVKAKTLLRSQVLGGGQEWNMRSGTESPASCVGFAEALQSAQAMRQNESKRLEALRKLFITYLKDEIPQAHSSASADHCVPNNVHIVIPGTDNERLMMALDEQGIICAVGSACSASSDEPSHVLKAIGLSDADAQSSLRFTLGRTTKQKDIEKTVEILAKLIV